DGNTHCLQIVFDLWGQLLNPGVVRGQQSYREIFSASFFQKRFCCFWVVAQVSGSLRVVWVAFRQEGCCLVAFPDILLSTNCCLSIARWNAWRTRSSLNGSFSVLKSKNGRLKPSFSSIVMPAPSSKEALSADTISITSAAPD